jgi:glycosyltransferase involved in cell wall biosynthesis
MRVALLTNFIPPYRIPLFEQLRSRVDELKVFISTPMERGRDWNPAWGDLPVTVQRTLTWHQVVRHPAGFSGRNALHFPIDTLSQLERFRPDVVITGELGLRSLLALLHCLRRPKTGLVLWATLSERTESATGHMRRLLRRWLVSRPAVMLVNGASGARYIVGLGVPPERIIQMPYSVDLKAFRGIPTRSPECAHRMLHVGQLIERKGVIQFLEALAQYAAKNPCRLEVWLAGEGPLRSTIELASYPPNLHVRLLGHVEYNQLAQIYLECGILAFPTLSDEWGMVVNEAMAMGLPVLGSVHAQAVEELIEDGGTGWVFDAAVTSSTQRAIERAMTADPEILDAMRARAMAAVSWIAPERMADRMIDACRLALCLRQGGNGSA